MLTIERKRSLLGFTQWVVVFDDTYDIAQFDTYYDAVNFVREDTYVVELA